MPSESLSPQEANDLLHKLITESTPVQGAFVSPVSGVRAVVWGVIRVSSTGLLNIVEREDYFADHMLRSVTRRLAKVWGREVDKRKSRSG
jgi:hypothetical protein